MWRRYRDSRYDMDADVPSPSRDGRTFAPSGSPSVYPPNAFAPVDPLSQGERLFPNSVRSRRRLQFGGYALTRSDTGDTVDWDVDNDSSTQPYTATAGAGAAPLDEDSTQAFEAAAYLQDAIDDLDEQERTLAAPQEEAEDNWEDSDEEVFASRYPSRYRHVRFDADEDVPSPDSLPFNWRPPSR